MTGADRLAAAYAEVLQRSASRGAGRLAATVAGLPVVSLGLPERWANVVLAIDAKPDAASVMEALALLAARGLSAQVLVRQRDVGAVPELRPVDRMPAFVAPGPSGMPAARPGRVVEPARDADAFRAVYGRAFEMRPGMADALVDPADLEAPDDVHLIARVDEGEAVGCALLRSASGLGYVSAVGVVPEHRGRGIGTTLLDACAARATADGCHAVWLHASASSQAFYAGLGYELVDTHVALG